MRSPTLFVCVRESMWRSLRRTVVALFVGRNGAKSFLLDFPNAHLLTCLTLFDTITFYDLSLHTSIFELTTLIGVARVLHIHRLSLLPHNRQHEVHSHQNAQGQASSRFRISITAPSTFGILEKGQLRHHHILCFKVNVSRCGS